MDIFSSPYSLHSKQRSAQIVDETASNLGGTPNLLSMEDDIFFT